MKKRAICAALCLSLCLPFANQAVAVDDGVTVPCNDVALAHQSEVVYDNNAIYVSYLPVVKFLYPDANASWVSNYAHVTATGLDMKIRFNKPYLEVNGRYLYAPSAVREVGQTILVSLDVLSKALGADLEWIPATGSVHINTPAVPLESGSTFYDSDDLYWLSHIINAESGNQPLTGKIAVGNVVMNRVKDSRFPGNIHDVIFQRSQFSPASSGSIYRTPNEDSVIAAKLCLDGANTVGKSLYFVNPRIAPRSWASRNRPHVATIGAHAFFA